MDKSAGINFYRHKKWAKATLTILRYTNLNLNNNLPAIPSTLWMSRIKNAEIN